MDLEACQGAAYQAARLGAVPREVAVDLGQIVLTEIDHLKRVAVAELLALPPMSERKVEVSGKAADLLVFRENSHDGRTIIVAKAFTPRFLVGSNAAADGFAIPAAAALRRSAHLLASAGAAWPSRAVPPRRSPAADCRPRVAP